LATASTVALAGASDAYAAPAYNWTGFYIGVNGGATSHQASTNDLNHWGGTGLTPYVNPWFKSNTTAASFGGQAGYGWQMNYLVFGVEADVSYIGASQTFKPPENLVAAGCGGCFTSATNELTWLTTVRGRLGVAVDRIMFYGTAGAAVGQISNSWGWDSVVPFHDTFSVSETKAGYVVGLGMEAMLMPHVSVRAEFLHVDLGTSRSTITGQPNCCQLPGTFTTEFRNTADMGRVGLSYRW
jgi:outer membrane immunogenic protein